MNRFDIVRHIASSRSKWLEFKEDCVLHIVFGNESFDLDSFVSSMTFSYILQQDYHRLQGHASSTETASSNATESLFFKGKCPMNPNYVVIPMVPLTAEDIQLRADICHLLKDMGIGLDQLVYMYDGHVMVWLFESCSV